MPNINVSNFGEAVVLKPKQKASMKQLYREESSCLWALASHTCNLDYDVYTPHY